MGGQEWAPEGEFKKLYGVSGKRSRSYECTLSAPFEKSAVNYRSEAANLPNSCPSQPIQEVRRKAKTVELEPLKKDDD